MKNLGKIVMIAALTISINSFAASYAQTRNAKSAQTNESASGRPDMPPPPMRDGLNPRMLDQLNLSDAQKEQIHTLMENSRASSREQFEKVRAIDDQLQTVVQAASFNEEQARQLLAAKAQATIELDIARLRTESAIYNLLTTEQKGRLEQIKQERPAFPPHNGSRPDAPPQN